MRLLVLLSCLATGACGLKGDLYLPPEPMAAEPSTASDDETAKSEPAAEQAGSDSAIESTDDVDDRPAEADNP